MKSILHDVLGHLPTNWLDNVVRLQKLEYFGHVTRHNGLEKTLMQGMVAEKQRENQDRYGRSTSQYTFGTMAAASRVAVDMNQFRRDI